MIISLFIKQGVVTPILKDTNLYVTLRVTQNERVRPTLFTPVNSAGWRQYLLDWLLLVVF